MMKSILPYLVFGGMFFVTICIPLFLFWLSKHDLFAKEQSRVNIPIEPKTNIWLINGQEVYGIETWWQGRHIIYDPVTENILAIIN